jgi:hypothetical protein
MSEHDKDPQTSEWHLDKRIPVALIAAITLQFAGSVYWIATLESRAISNTERIAKLEEQMDPVRLSLQRIAQQLESIERALRRREDDR